MTRAKKIQWIMGLMLLSIMACQKTSLIEPLYFPKLMEIPAGFPAVTFPEDNAFSQERWDLGKRLFFDPIMSVDSTISCANCHLPQLAFSDEKSVSVGVSNRLGQRNSPSLANVAYHPYFTREGGVPTLEMQILIPIQEHNEFDFNIVLLAEKLQQQEEYVQMSELAYGRTPDAFVITRALATYERSLLSGNSRYDQYQFQGYTDVLSKAELRGMDLFFGEQTNCSKCHSDFNFTNYQFENNGLYEVYKDNGRFRLTSDSTDLALFKVPTLRNIAITAPYMHDGSYTSLEAVIQHYNEGGHPHSQKSEWIRPLNLSKEEQNDLIQFLNTLTDETFIKNPIFSN